MKNWKGKSGFGEREFFFCSKVPETCTEPLACWHLLLWLCLLIEEPLSTWSLGWPCIHYLLVCPRQAPILYLCPFPALLTHLDEQKRYKKTWDMTNSEFFRGEELDCSMLPLHTPHSTCVIQGIQSVGVHWPYKSSLASQQGGCDVIKKGEPNGRTWERNGGWSRNREASSQLQATQSKHSISTSRIKLSGENWTCF